MRRIEGMQDTKLECRDYPVRTEFRDQLLADIDRIETANIARLNREAYDRLLARLALEGGQLTIDNIQVEVELSDE